MDDARALVMRDLDVRGWSMADLARASGVSHDAIARWLSGQSRTMRLQTQRSIERAFGYEPGRLSAVIAGTADQVNDVSLLIDIETWVGMTKHQQDEAVATARLAVLKYLREAGIT